MEGSKPKVYLFAPEYLKKDVEKVITDVVDVESLGLPALPLECYEDFLEEIGVRLLTKYKGPILVLLPVHEKYGSFVYSKKIFDILVKDLSGKWKIYFFFISTFGKIFHSVEFSVKKNENPENRLKGVVIDLLKKQMEKMRELLERKTERKKRELIEVGEEVVVEETLDRYTPKKVARKVKIYVDAETGEIIRVPVEVTEEK